MHYAVRALVALALVATSLASFAADANTAKSFTLQDFRGKVFSLDDLTDQKAIVLAFLGCECPLAGQYAETLRDLSEKHAKDGVTVWGIFSNQQDAPTEIGHFAKAHRVEYPLLKDPGNVVADQFKATRTPEVVVLDGKKVVRYHGRIDDQFTYGKQRPKAEHDYLGDAVASLLAGKNPEVAHAEPVGCLIGKKLEPDVKSPVTYTEHVAKILFERCVNCHRPGEIGPFSLTNYEETVGWAEMIAEVVGDGRMPPWHANPAHGKFRNDARLSDSEKQMIATWVKHGAPQGDTKLMPKLPEFVEGWQIGKPDMVVYMSDKPMNVPAKGEVRYQYYQVDPGFKEDKWVVAAECRPGNRAVVHHIILGIAPPGGRGRNVGDVHSEWLTATAPGAAPLMLKNGHAKLIPAGSKLVFQMHYTPNGTATTDRSSVGLTFCDAKDVKHQVGTDQASTGKRLNIPANEANYKIDATHAFSRDMKLLALFPHMHLRGKAFRYTAVYPDGKEEILLDIPRYDFAWQNAYEFEEPKLMPRGTRLRCEAVFDNSTENLANPNPNSIVRWGDQTWEEMMIGYFDATPAESKSFADKAPRLKEFEAAVAKGSPALSPEVKALAKEALLSDEKLLKFGAELRKTVPQLDRICWTTVEDNQLHIARVAQAPEYAKAGGSGRKLPVAVTAVAAFAKKTEPVIIKNLGAERGLDLQFMSRIYSSSVHIPTTIADDTGTLNFWSNEPDAFPPAAVEVLKQVVELLKQ